MGIDKGSRRRPLEWPVEITSLLPLFFELFHKLSLQILLSLQAFGLYPRKGVIQVGSDADFVLVDLKKEVKISDDKVFTNVGWTPYDGMKVKGIPVMTVVAGKIVMRDGEIIGKRGLGGFTSRHD